MNVTVRVVDSPFEPVAVTVAVCWVPSESPVKESVAEPPAAFTRPVFVEPPTVAETSA